MAFRGDGLQLAAGTWDGWIGLFPAPGDGKPAAEVRFPGAGDLPGDAERGVLA